MTKQAAIHSFWSRFGLKAYDESSVPDNAMTVANGKYITYSVATSAFNEPIPLTASLWYRSITWADISIKVDEIERVISRGGIMVPCEDGAIWITKGSPFAQRVFDGDDTIRRVYLNIVVEYLTED